MKSPCEGWLSTACIAVLASLPLELITQSLPPHYSMIADPESNLAVGPYGFLEATVFFLRGSATLLVMHAARHILQPPPGRARLGAYLLQAAGIAKLVLALAPTDIAPRPETLHGVIHALAALVAFGAGAAGQLVIGYGMRRNFGASAITRVLVWLGWVLAIFGMVVIGTLPVAARLGCWGVLERIQTALSLSWFLLSVIPLWRRAGKEHDVYAGRTNEPFVPTRQ